MDKPRIVLVSALGALVVGGLVFATLGREFIPTLDEGDIDCLRRIARDNVVEERITDVDQFADTLAAVFDIAVPMPPEVWDKVLTSIQLSEAA